MKFNFKVLHQNLQCIKNKIEDLEVFLSEEDPNVACITESWCNDDDINYIRLLDYSTAGYYNRKKSIHGGVMILIKNSLNFVAIPECNNLSMEKIFECAGVSVTINNEEIGILCIYRAPNSDLDLFLDKFEECLNLMCRKNHFGKIIVCGDMNINYLSESHDKDKLIDLINSLYLNPIFNEATRITPTSESAIDYIFTNFNNIIVKKRIIHNGLSDHSAQVISFPVTEENKYTNYKSRSFSKKNIKLFTSYLETEDWNDLINCNGDIDEKFSIFNNILLYYYDLSFKLVTKTKHNFCKTKNWITPGLKVSAANLKDLFIQQKQGSITLNYYNTYKKIYRRTIRQAKQMYYNNQILYSDNRSKVVWNIISSSIKNFQPQTNSSRIVNDVEVLDKKEIANAYNNFFVNLPKEIRINKQNDTKINNLIKQSKFTNKTIFLEAVTDSEVTSTLKNLKNTNSTGPDQFSTSIIKKCAIHLAKPLCHIINICISEGCFPNLLKISKVIALFKKGDPKLLSNYRPISLLSVFSKIIEKILAKRIIKFLESNNLLANSQHGFRHNKSTMSALLSILDVIYSQLDKNNNVIALFVDLTKAFDCVDHEVLLKKIELYGLRGKCNDLLRSYLFNRKQFVNYLGQNSDELIIDVGVPQGSVLGPLLFLLYCNDLEEYLSIFHCEFADDMTIVAFNKEQDVVNQQLNNNLPIIYNYLSSICLKINQEKTHILQFHPLPANYTSSPLIRLNGKTIEQVTSFKLLGMHIDISLSWREHVNYICKKCASTCFALKRLHTIASKNTTKIFYYSNFESVIRYGIILFGYSSAANRVFIMQKRAIRCMFGLKFRESCKQIFIREQILTFPCIYILDILKFVRQNISNFNLQNEYHDYNTRHGQNLQYHIHRLELYKSNPYYMGAKLYNKLPPSIKNLSISKFASQVKKLLLSNAFYSINEFMSHVFY